MKKALAILLALLVLAVVGHFVYRATYDVHPEPPPRGARAAGPVTFERESSIHLPIAIDIGLIAAVAEQQLPIDLMVRDGIDAGNGVTADVKLRRAGKITAVAQGGKLGLRVPVEADIAARWRPTGLMRLAQRGRDQAITTHAAFTIDAELGLHVDAHWQLATSTTATLRWDEDPLVQIGPMPVRLSAIAGDRIRQQFDAAIHTIDDTIRRRVPSHRLITQAWDAAFKTLPIGTGGDLWVALHPTGLFIGDVQARDGQVFLDAGIRGVFRVVVGDRPATADLTPLPAPSPPPSEPGLALDVALAISFEAANEQLDRRVEGQVIEVPLKLVDRTVPVTIERVELYPSGERLAVAIEFSADLRGHLFDLRGQMYLLGTPTLDPTRRELTVADLDYDSRTDVALVDAAEWLLHDTILRAVQEHLVFPYTAPLADIRRQANETIADYQVARGVKLHGHFEEVRVQGLEVTDAAIVALAQIRGHARLVLTDR